MNATDKPADPRKISFAPECFELTGEVQVTYLVLRSALHSGPARFDSYAGAAAYARRCGREVVESRVPVKRRVRWTL